MLPTSGDLQDGTQGHPERGRSKRQVGSRGAWLAWSVEHVTLDLGIMGSSPPPTGSRDDLKIISFKKI